MNGIVRIAIIGAGPAGFYVADRLLKQKEWRVEIDMFDRLTPHGLVRYGVAPDHLNIKSVTRVFDAIARNPCVHFYGNVAFGQRACDITLNDFRRLYHAAVFATGAQTDRPLNIPGEDLKGSHAATEFVAWYNGHPDFCDIPFDLSGERAAIVGIGNVALDVARMLCLDPKTLLKKTDMPEYAWRALCRSRIKQVMILARRGPAQAACDNAMLRELMEMNHVKVAALPQECELDVLSAAEIAGANDKEVAAKVEIFKHIARASASATFKKCVRDRKIIFRFCVSPTAIVGDEHGNVRAMRIAKNELQRAADGTLRAKTTNEVIELPVDIIFRSVGYQGVALSGVPFRDGIIPNEKGRIIDPQTHQHIVGLYAAGWIKRGPTGVIGTNKPDAAETVACLLEDVKSGRIWDPIFPRPEESACIVRRRARVLSYEDWKYIDEAELRAGAQCGRPREKFVRMEDMFAVRGKEVQ